MSLEFRIDVTDIATTIERVARLGGPVLRRAAARAANGTAKQVRDVTNKAIGARIALDAAFIDQRSTVKEARETDLLATALLVAPATKASARAFGLDSPLSSLRNYGPRQLTEPVKYTNSSIAKLIGKYGRNPRKPGAFLPWKARKGDPLRGIVPDRKAAGVSVEVRRAARKRIATAFLAPLRAGRSGVQAGGLGVFQREGRRLKLLYGPAVYRLFRDEIARSRPKIEQLLRDTTTREVNAVLRESLL